MMRLAQSIYQILARHGVDTVFGIPGNHNLALYRDLDPSKIHHVTARHEQGVGFMADGYARASGRPGVGFLIGGPGVSNAATAMAQALADSIPLVIIATVGDHRQRRGALHELPDQLALAASVCLEAVAPQDPLAALKWIDQAMSAHLYGRPGPRYIQIPLSWWETEVVMPAPLPLLSLPVAQISAIVAAAELLERAARPLLVLGGGSVCAGAEIATLALGLGAPVLNTVNAKGVYNGAFALGASPSLPAAQALMQQADVLIVVGSEMGETDFDLLMTDSPALSSQLIRIDIDADQVLLNGAPEVALVGDARLTLQALLEQSVFGDAVTLEESRRRCWLDIDQTRIDFANYHHMHEQFGALFKCIDQALPDAVIVGDSTRPTYYASWMWERSAPRRYFHCVSGYGTLGYALPGALGAKLSQPELPVIALIGDGGIMFSIGELAVAVQERLAIKILIWDNQGYQEIAQSMQGAGIDNSVAHIQGPDFGQLAQAFGAEVSQPKTLQALATCLQRSTNGPHVIWLQESEFIVDPAGEWY